MHTCAELRHSDLDKINITSTIQTIMECVSKELDTYKQNQKRNSSKITLFIEDEFYDSVKEFLKSQGENALSDTTELINWQATTLKRKKWSFHQGKILTTDKKIVAPKSQLYDILTLAHQRTAHRGRQITSKWINENYSEVNVQVVNLFVSLCQIHQEKKTITSHVLMVTKPLQSPEFLSLIEIDFMDFRNTPCECKNVHTWAMNIIDHHTKYVTVVPLQQKTADEVLKNLREYCYTYGFPKKTITDNGREFQNNKIKNFCNDNAIELSHGAPRTPTTYLGNKT
ncbi:KRAB-A domain-containing protein 2-like [Acropora muricata]|uniref:KRAB-A domain-containing protein 2-like n=1 Tax=Acropora muricata TaxID=159855 RepID=UPI0034E3B4FB